MNKNRTKSKEGWLVCCGGTRGPGVHTVATSACTSGIEICLLAPVLCTRRSAHVANRPNSWLAYPPIRWCSCTGGIGCEILVLWSFCFYWSPTCVFPQPMPQDSATVVAIAAMHFCAMLLDGRICLRFGICDAGYRQLPPPSALATRSRPALSIDRLTTATLPW